MTFAFIMVALIIGYPVVGYWMLFVKRWPLRAGASTLVIALLPIGWLLTLPPKESGVPGAGILLLISAIPIGISLSLIVAGVLLATIKYTRRLRSH